MVQFQTCTISNTQERKPVTNSRDTQELLPDAGQEMLRIFFTHPARTSLLQDFAFYEACILAHPPRNRMSLTFFSAPVYAEDSTAAATVSCPPIPTSTIHFSSTWTASLCTP